MASNVSSALGTQRQFAPQPQGVYQKQLLVPSGDTTAGAGSKAARLANALGLMGDTLRGEITKQNERDKKWGAFKAEEIKKDPRTADKIFATSQQMLAATGNEALTDNPYAMAQLDMWRGENAARDLRNRYHEEVVLKEGSCQTRAEEQQRWMQFFTDHAKEYNISTDYLEANEKAQTDGDSTAPNAAAAIGTIKPISSFKNANSSTFFNMGLYDNFDTYTQREVDRQMTDAAQNRKALREGTLTAKLSEFTSPENVSSKSADELKDDLYNIVIPFYKAGGRIPDAYPIIAKAMDEFTANNGTNKLEDVFGTVVAFDPDGHEYTLKELLPYEEYHGAGIAMDAARREKNMVDIMGKLSNAKTLDEYDKAVEDIKTNNPHEFSILAQKNLLNSGRADLKQKLEYEKRQRMRGMSGATGKAVKQYYSDAFISNGEGWFNALYNNNSAYGGRPITAPFQVTGVDSNGNPVTRAATSDEIVGLGNHLLTNILSAYGNGDIDLEEAVHRESKLLTAPQMKEFKNSIRDAVSGSLMDIGDIDWDNASYSDSNLQNIQMACDIYTKNPAYASAIFGGQGNSVVKAIESIVSLADTEDAISYHNPNELSDGLKNALKKYGNVYLQSQNDTISDRVNKEFNTAYGDVNNRIVEVDACSVNDDHSPEMQSIDLSSSDYLQDRVETLAKTYMYMGMSADSAVQKAADKIRGQVFTYASMTFPKDMCVNIDEPPEWQGVAAKQGITNIVSELGGADDCNWKYDYVGRRFVFWNSSTGVTKTYTESEFAERVNDQLHNPEKYGITDDSYTDDNEEDNPTEELTSVEYDGHTYYE